MWRAAGACAGDGGGAFFAGGGGGADEAAACVARGDDGVGGAVGVTGQLGVLGGFELRHFGLPVLAFRAAALPALAPVAYEELEAPAFELDAGQEADAQVAEVHLVLVRVVVQQADVAGYGEEDVVVVGREVGEGVAHGLGWLLGVFVFGGEADLFGLGE